VAGYPVGRIVFEFMRSDEANEILGLRVNVWTSVLVFVLGVTLFWLFGRRAALRERVPETSHHPG
jgi:prolipoprotein diacylglyceryltransferase